MRATQKKEKVDKMKRNIHYGVGAEQGINQIPKLNYIGP